MFTSVFGALVVRDYERSLAWYAALLDRPPDLVPTEGEACWQLTDTSWIYILTEPERAGGSVQTLLVDDFDHWVAQAGDAAGPVEILPSQVQTVWVTDPDGNRVQFAQPLD